jgi:hypothetical protein
LNAAQSPRRGSKKRKRKGRVVGAFSFPDLAVGAREQFAPLGRINNLPESAITPGLRADGTPYAAIIRRRCRCLDCGQVRIEKEYA